MVVLSMEPYLPSRTSCTLAEVTFCQTPFTQVGSPSSAIAVTAHGAVFDAAGSYVPSLVGNMALYVVAAACMVIGFRMRPFKEITKQAK